ncbi:MAG: NADP-dependent oxidoreductase [Herpetosiphon sp.]
MTTINHRYLLASRPVGLPTRENWTFDSKPLPEPEQDQVVVKTLYLSLDPAMRGWMDEGRSYIRPVAIGEVMLAVGVGKVTASRHPDFVVGDVVTGSLGIQTYALLPASELTKIDPTVAPLPKYLHPLGFTGMTAYFGLLDVGQAKAGESVLVSAAAGAVGSLAGQIAKLKGCHVVGIAGGSTKCHYLTHELGFDAAIDYKTADLRAALTANCPSGVDLYFDNVGGDMLDTVLTRLRRGARVAICGAISQYNATQPHPGLKNYMSLLVNRARMQGFVVFDYAPRYAEAARELAAWMAAGKLHSREHIVTGLETFPERLLMLFRGENDGKLILQVAEA